MFCQNMARRVYCSLEKGSELQVFLKRLKGRYREIKFFTYCLLQEKWACQRFQALFSPSYEELQTIYAVIRLQDVLLTTKEIIFLENCNQGRLTDEDSDDEVSRLRCFLKLRQISFG